MRELLQDVKERMDTSDSLGYINEAGGVLRLPSLEQFPQQQKTPCIVLIDAGTSPVLHLSSGVVWREILLTMHFVQRLFRRQEIITGSPFYRGVEEMAKDGRKLLDKFRFNGKYARAFLIREEIPAPLDPEKHQHLQEKALTFRYVRIECE